MESLEICHLCEEEAESYCIDCKEPVCENCCVTPTYENQIDYSLCTACEDEKEAMRYEESMREYKREEQAKIKKDKRNAKQKANYWKPQNIEKRRLAKIEKRKLRIEQLKEAMKSIASLFQ